MPLAEAIPTAVSTIGGLVNLFGGAGGGGEDEAQKALELWLQLQDPSFDFSQLSPAQLSFISQVAPSFYEPTVPGEVALAEEGPTRSDQLTQLAYLKDVAREGLPLADRLQAQDATNTIAREAHRAQQAVMRSMAERGRLGPGHELAARQLAAQGETALMGEMGSNLALDAVNRRYGAALDAADLAGGIRAGDERLGAYNADLTNRFNQLVSQMKTDASRYAAEERNRFAMRNAEEQQRTADANALLSYETRKENLDRFNQLQQQLAGFKLGRTAGATGQYGQLATRADAEQARRAAGITGIADATGGLLSELLKKRDKPAWYTELSKVRN